MPRKAGAKPTGPKALSGSADAKRKAAVILETLGGLRTTQSASEELEIAPMRYYVLETRMLQAMIDALEPQARGRKRAVEKEVAKLRDDKAKLEREVLRLQALYRMTQRAVGVREVKKPSARSKGKVTKTRRVHRQSRGERVLAKIREATVSADNGAATVRGDPASQGGT